MENKIQQRNIYPQKIITEKLNGRFLLLGFFALVGSFISTGQFFPGEV